MAGRPFVPRLPPVGKTIYDTSIVAVFSSLAMVKTPFLHKQPAKKLLGIDLVSLEKQKREAPLFPVLLEPLGFFQGEQAPGPLRLDRC